MLHREKNGKQNQAWLIHFNPAGVSCSQNGRNVYLGIQNYTESQYGCWFYSPRCCYDKLLYQCWILLELIFLFRTNIVLWVFVFFSFGLCCFCLLVFLGRIGSAEVCLGSHQPWRQGSLIYVVPNVFFFSSHILITDLQKHAVVALNVMGVNTPIKKTYTIFNQLKTLQVLASSAHSNALREKQKDSGETKVGVLVLHL